MRILKVIGQLFIVIVLTLATQIGGLIWLLSLGASWKYRKKIYFIFPLLYLLFNLIIVPPVALLFHREPLPVFNQQLKPRNLIYPLLFRNYVHQDLALVLKRSATSLSKKNTCITYLDANFPLFNGFPLLPHLSHNDGKKIDISFMYKEKSGLTTDKKPSVSGYGVYVQADNATSKHCLKSGYWQYDFPKHLTCGSINNLDFDTQNTKVLIEEFLLHAKTQKIFIEPYFKNRLQLNHPKIRFHGCQAVRHDDHIHLQIK